VLAGRFMGAFEHIAKVSARRRAITLVETKAYRNSGSKSRGAMCSARSKNAVLEGRNAVFGLTGVECSARGVEQVAKEDFLTDNWSRRAGSN